MSLVKKVKAVERLFDRLDAEIADVKNTTGLGCVAFCGRCCTKPDIEATVLEFLPFAYYTFKEGKALELRETLCSLLADQDSLCILFAPTISGQPGFCTDYVHRGLICRLFGFSARTAKTGQREWLSCGEMKAHKSDELGRVNELLESGSHVPMASDYGYSLLSIDRDLGSLRMPINLAIRKALEYVLSYYAYRRRSG